MKKLTVLLAVLCVLLCGCESWMDGQYYNEVPHTRQDNQLQQAVVKVSVYSQLQRALSDTVDGGGESLRLSVEGYDPAVLEEDLEKAAMYIQSRHAIGVYAVSDITWELGTGGGLQMVAVTVTYNQNYSMLRSIRQVQTMQEAMELITAALEQCDAGIVVKIENFAVTDFAQVIQDYADQYPELVMEMPQVKVTMYPENGVTRVLELQFTYQNSRDDLRAMKRYVQPVFSAARIYVSGVQEDSIKYSQMYAFLMERYDYSYDSSITPAYSLLRYGVGDSKAFAVVFDAMCRQSELECMVVVGTRDGESRYWNIICQDGVYYHVDLLRCGEAGKLLLLSDEEMQGYVWDYLAYPACGVKEEPQMMATE
ncbi:MAG: transglutaminase family protein [Oscillospiraceae bacterium]|nr:transglutaminase family protein [Oscillospiraceae bacterium]